ncbi:MAG: sugar phosphate isomerase/epimerase [Proteobacteria bacterium]|nr:sugar phosphate isomerase/epimerase [Pseudomonadota bacterium]
MIRLAVSNIALPAFDHADDFGRLREFGIEAIEVAPSRVWQDTWKGLAPDAVADYRRRIEDAGLDVVGLHSLFYDQPRLGLFKEPTERAESLDFLEHLSGVCRDLGGRTLIYGGGRQRGALPEDEALAEAVDFFGELTKRVETHGTCFCFEPLGPGDSDFINSALDSLAIVEEVASPALRVQLDAKALVENGEAVIETFEAVRSKLVHFHANEPGLGVLGSTGEVDHALFGNALHAIGYKGYVSIEQRMLSQTDPLADLMTSAEVVKAAYGNGGGGP